VGELTALFFWRYFGMDSLLGFLLTLVLLTGGLALIAARWKSWRPVFHLYLQIMRASAILMLYTVYYALVVASRLIQVGGKSLQRGGQDVRTGGRQRRDRP
jgi:hypothetical protein